MSISITFRHVEASEAIKTYAAEKVDKLQKFLRKPITVKVTLSLEKHQQSAEVQLSSGSEHIEAKVVTDDMYAAIDAAMDKIERQIREHKGSAQSKRRRGESLKDMPAASLAAE